MRAGLLRRDFVSNSIWRVRLGCWQTAQTQRNTSEISSYLKLRKRPGRGWTLLLILFQTYRHFAKRWNQEILSGSIGFIGRDLVKPTALSSARTSERPGNFATKSSSCRLVSCRLSFAFAFTLAPPIFPFQ